MAFLQGIRQKIGSYILEKKVNDLSRNKQFINLADSATIGIVFHQPDNGNFKAIQEFMKMLAAEGKQIAALGYIEGKNVPDFYLLRKGFNFFCDSDLNWFHQPEAGFVDDFVKREFDILINLSIDNSFPVEYIYALSNAKFKVGIYANGISHSDLVIDVKDNHDVDYLIGQITHYLRIINRKQ